MRSKFTIIVTLLISFMIGFTSCSTTKKPLIPLSPRYNGVDAQIQPYVDEWMKLSAENNITFSKKVTVGVDSIDSGNIVGLCTYGMGWREIEIDKKFLATNSELRTKALVFHELTHCYCKRPHDHSHGEEYPEGMIEKINKFMEKPRDFLKQKDGFFTDSCPTSIMHPEMQTLYCYQKHWDHYVKEMFDGCEPF